MSSGIGQVASTRWVSAANRALLEMALEDVAAGEGVVAEDTHVGPVTRI